MALAFRIAIVSGIETNDRVSERMGIEKVPIKYVAKFAGRIAEAEILHEAISAGDIEFVERYAWYQMSTLLDKLMGV